MKCCQCKKEKRKHYFLGKNELIPYASCSSCRRKNKDPRKEIRKKYKGEFVNGWWIAEINLENRSLQKATGGIHKYEGFN